MQIGFTRTLYHDIRYALKHDRLLTMVLLLLLAAQFIRLFHCVDTTDEAYYFTNVIRMIQGDRLFIEIWDATQTGAILFLPFYRIYIALFGFDGLILFGRLLSFALRLIVFLFGYYALRESFPKKQLAAVLLLVIVYAPFSIYTLGYNNSGFLLCLLGSSLWLIGVRRKFMGTGGSLWLIFAGLSHAFMVACYPTTLLAVPIMVICQLVYAWVLHRDIPQVVRDLLWYAFGAGLVLTGLLLYISFVASWGGAFQSFQQMMSRPDSIKNMDFPRWASSLADLEGLFSRVSAQIMVVCLLLFCAAGIFAKATRRFSRVGLVPLAAFYGLWIAGSLYLVLTGDYGVVSSQDLVLVLSLPMPCLAVMFLGSEGRQARRLAFLAFGAPSIALTTVVTLSSGGGFLQGKYALFGFLIFSLLCFVQAAGSPVRVSKAGTTRRLLGAESLIAVIAIAASMIVLQYIDPYRDVPVAGTTTRVESGPAAGVYTTPEKASLLDQMQDDMDSVEVEDGRLLVIECYPYAYGLATDMRPAAPSTWLVSTRLGWGTDEYYWTNLFEYYDEFGIEPDVIFMDGSNRQSGFMDIAGADQQDGFDLNYPIHRFVLENYRCAVSRDDYSLWVRK